MKTIFLCFFVVSFLPFLVFAQCFFSEEVGCFVDASGVPCSNVIPTAVPIMEIETHAPTRGMGEIGVVSNSDYHVNFNQNPALLRQGKEGLEVRFHIMPWLVDQTFFSDITASWVSQKRHAFALGLKYFHLGTIFSSNRDFQANEYIPSFKYAYQLSPKWSVGLAIDYYISDLVGENPALLGVSAAKGLAADLGIHYKHSEKMNNGKLLNYQWGLAINNMGTKATYFVDSAVRDYIPTSLKLGGMIGLIQERPNNQQFSFSIAYQAEKLLVPTPSFDFIDENNNGIEDYQEHGFLEAIFVSFGDAPNGIKEEWWEVVHKLGGELEWEIHKKLSLAGRIGYYGEHRLKGNRQFITTGLSVKAFNFFVDFAYMPNLQGIFRPVVALNFGFGQAL